jgi:hypothetical protein
MTVSEKKSDIRSLEEVLESDLLSQYGPMLTGEALRKALGYPTMDAFRQALCRGTIPVPVFPLENRRGKFALVKDVACWLAEQRDKAGKKRAR